MEKTGDRKVLIVDDEIEVRRNVSSYLKRRRFEVYEARNGVSALKAVKKVKPDLIILDVVMPQMDGFEFLEKLKKDSLYSCIPVIMLTVKSQAEYLNKGISLNADFYLPKPFTLGNLMSFVNLILKD